ncbi:MAG TPA: hypothetical protein VKT29_08000, partial [Terriglobales bacterium]|nr:hypothetical protein [Terriglobales bacterium]
WNRAANYGRQRTEVRASPWSSPVLFFRRLPRREMACTSFAISGVKDAIAICQPGRRFDWRGNSQIPNTLFP